MARNNEYRGLCMTCGNSDTCTMPRNLRRPVFHCEWFAVGGLAAAEGEPPQGAAVPQETPDTAMGICCTCDDRNTCVFPKARRGVVSCEEYR